MRGEKMDILQTIIKTISAPVAAFLPRQNQAQQYRMQNQAVASHSQPQLTVKQQLQQLSPQIYTGKFLDAMSDQEAQSRLKIEQNAKAEQNIKLQESQASYQKYASGQQEILQKSSQKEQIEINSYQDREAYRHTNANQVFSKHQIENAPMLQYMANQEAYQNQNIPISVKFG